MENKKISGVNRVLMSITGVVKDEETAERIKAMLETADMTEMMASTCPCFDDWIENLPAEPIEGLAEECLAWIRVWANAGRDYSAEICIQDAICELSTDSPRALAEAIRNCLIDFRKSPYEASALTMNIVIESMAECSQEK